jgi:hypothetical protein
MSKTFVSCLWLLGIFALAVIPAAAQLSFVPQVQYVAGSTPETTALGDFNGDGDLDAAVTSDAPDKITIHSNNGAGVLTLTQTIQVANGSSPHFIVAADLDGDGDLDLAVTLKNVAALTVLLNNGGTFALSGVNVATGLEPRSLVAVNIDGDADVDLVTSNRDSNTLSVVRNNGNATFQPAVTVAVGQDPRHVDAADLDGDGDQDLVVANNDSNTVSVLLNNGTGTFVVVASLPTGSFDPEGIVAVDLDGDGDQDLAVAADDDTSIAQNAVLVFKNLGGATFGGFTSYAVNALGAGFIAAADMDLDGDMDVATANQDSNSVSALANNGQGAFGAPLVMPVGAGPEHVIAGDLNGDQVPDLVATNDGGTTISVLRNLVPNGTLTLLNPAAIGTVASVQISSPNDGGDFYVCVLSFGTVPGTNLADGRHFPVNNDALLALSLTPNPFLQNSSGVLSAAGTATMSVAVPFEPALVGLSIWSACAILNPAASLGIEQTFGPLQITFQ